MSRTTSWIFLFLPIMGLNFGSSGGEKHSLIYIYTGFSKDPGLPGLHQFTAMGLLDNKMIDYFDSDIKVKEPRQDWMKERLPPGYWTKGTESRILKEQWSKDIIQTLKDRLGQNDDDMHVLQWMHGCEATLTGGRSSFPRIIERYSYDGDDVFFSNDKLSVRVGPGDARLEITVLKEVPKDHTENECMAWLSTFLGFEERQLRKATPVKVFFFSKKTRVSSNVLLLTCFATGFYPEDVELNIRRDGRVLTAVDGLTSTGTRPNGDGTFQRRDSVEILRTDTATYSCEVNHRASNVHVTRQWGVCPKDELFCLTKAEVFWTVVVAVLVLVFSVGITVTLDRKYDRKCVSVSSNTSCSREQSGDGDDSSEQGLVSPVSVVVPDPSSRPHEHRSERSMQTKVCI